MKKFSEEQIKQELGTDFWEKVSKFYWNCERIGLKTFSTLDVMDSCGWKGKSKTVNQVLKHMEFLGKVKSFKEGRYCKWEIISK